MIQGIGTEDCLFVLVFDNGYFSEFGTFSISDWIGHTPPGRARMGVFGSHGRVRIEEFNAGDVGYVPQGYGHYIENIGNEDVELLIALNNGAYESISLADWIGANSPLLLATNFEVPESTFKDF